MTGSELTINHRKHELKVTICNSRKTPPVKKSKHHSERIVVPLYKPKLHLYPEQRAALLLSISTGTQKNWKRVREEQQGRAKDRRVFICRATVL